MSAGASDIKAVGVLMLALLGLVVIGMLTFVLGAQFQKTLCVDIDEGTYGNGTCSVESQAWNQTERIVLAIVLVVSFLSIIVLVAIAKLILRNIKGFAGGM